MFGNFRNLLASYLFDLRRDLKFSWVNGGKYKDKERLLAAVAVDAHTIEKGLTMPEKRFNFGHSKLKNILYDLSYCISHFDDKGDRFLDIVGIIKEYKRWHDINGQSISDNELSKKIENLLSKYPEIRTVTQIYEMQRETYFSSKDEAFPQFAFSRHSCRNFSGPVDESALLSALELAVNTVPSTCNRQSVRVHVFSNDEILQLQHGSRGFGHLADKYILVTSALSHWPSVTFRHAPYVDGGIFHMNLLYALHYYGIAACTLNMYLSNKEMKILHDKFKIPENQVPIALIAIGTPPEKFDLARSTRRAFSEIVTFH